MTEKENRRKIDNKPEKKEVLGFTEEFIGREGCLTLSLSLSLLNRKAHHF